MVLLTPIVFVKEYLQAIAATGHATEHSYRAAVETLFHQLYPKLDITKRASPPGPLLSG